MVKKALSYFMPEPPPYINGHGNPTKSKVINDLIKFVQLCEVRHEGAPSKAKRAFSQAEFRKELELMVRHDPKCLKLTVRYRAMSLWQYHLVGRVDDAANSQLVALKVHNLIFPELLQTAVSWSKNVRDERRCPDQILLGSMDPMQRTCLLMDKIQQKSMRRENPKSSRLPRD
jgi:hypothetical protein